MVRSFSFVEYTLHTRERRWQRRDVDCGVMNRVVFSEWHDACTLLLQKAWRVVRMCIQVSCVDDMIGKCDVVTSCVAFVDKPKVWVMITCQGRTRCFELFSCLTCRVLCRMRHACKYTQANAACYPCAFGICTHSITMPGNFHAVSRFCTPNANANA